MSSFTEPLIVKKINARQWEVERAFEYHIGFKYSNEVIRIPKGFITDFASVPRLFWIIFPPDGIYTQAAVVHDFLYYTKKYTRLKSDRIFLEAMKVLGVGWWRRSTMYNAVRLAGWMCWKNKNTYGGLIITMLILVLLSGCCHYSPDTKTIYGFGSYKDKEIEMECKSPLSDFINLSGIKAN